MTILALNLGNISSWAVYNNKLATKIVGGRIIFKKDPEETIKAPYKRFRNILENAMYNHDGISKIYFQHPASGNQNVFNCYLKALSDFSRENQIPCEKVKLHDVLTKTLQIELYNKDIIIDKIKQKKLKPKDKEHIIEDDVDAIAIAMIYHVLKYKQQKEEQKKLSKQTKKAA